MCSRRVPRRQHRKVGARRDGDTSWMMAVSGARPLARILWIWWNRGCFGEQSKPRPVSKVGIWIGSAHTPAVVKGTIEIRDATYKVRARPKRKLSSVNARARSVSVIGCAGMRTKHPSGSRQKRSVFVGLTHAAVTPGSYEPQTRLGTWRRPREAGSVVRPPRGGPSTVWARREGAS
jgi:hypothetical protein